MKRSTAEWITRIALMGALWSSHAAAQGNEAAADALFNEAQASMEKAEYATACQRFRESDRLDPAIGTKLNLAICEEKRGKVATAWDLCQAVIDKAEATDERHAMAQDLADKLKPRVPTLTIRLEAGAPGETVVSEGELVLRAASFGVALPIDPGKHTFVVTAPGHDESSASVELREGEHGEVEIAPGRQKRVEALSMNTVGLSNALEASRAKPKTLGFALGGVGVVGIGVGAVTGVMALGKKSTADQNCNDQLRTCTQAGKDADSGGRSLMTVSTVGWVVGAAGLAGAGAYLLLSSGGGDEPEFALRTSVAPGGTSASLIGHW